MKSSEITNDSIARSASRLRWTVIAAMAVMALLYLAARFGLSIGEARVEYEHRGASAEVARVIGDILLLLLLMALFQLTRMLSRIAGGELFTAGVIGRFRSFALWLLLSALFGLFAPFVLQLLGLVPGDRHLVRFAIDFREILTVGVTLVLFLLARLLERARRLDEEVREFV
jgi:hypothetical protein